MIRRFYHRILAVLYIGLMLVCIPVVIKPGASIFYFKKTIASQAVKPEEGFAYLYELKANAWVFRTQGILLFENGRQLDRSDGYIVAGTGKGTYSPGKPYQGSVTVHFSASDNSDPVVNGRKYSLYIPLNIISRFNGIVLLVILLTGLAWFLFFMLANPEQRRILAAAPGGIWTVLDHFFEHVDQISASEAGPLGPQITSRARVWKWQFTVTVLAAFFYVFMEWVFFVTMPSFMSILSLFEKIEILLLSGLAFSILCMSVLAVVIGLDLIALARRRSKITRHPGTILPAILLSGLALILIDNFTYTLFKFGISTSTGIWRGAYALLFLSLLVAIFILLVKIPGLRGGEVPVEQSSNRLFLPALAILVISAGLGITRLDLLKSNSSGNAAGTSQDIRHTSILLLGGDGLNAENMSVYGYGRETTPRLRDLAQVSLLAENAFTNAGNSYGSVASILTGRLPTQTRVQFLPDILTGVDAFLHLPGILRDQGYGSYQLGVPYYVDANSFNMQNGFNTVNDRPQSQTKLWTLVRGLGYDNPAYFLDRLTERISTRILHIFYIREMVNPFTLVTQPVEGLDDSQKINQVIKLIDQSEGPFFIHAHLMGTHGPVFKPGKRVFSKGEKQDGPWMEDFYDDAILDFDGEVGKVVDHLKATGQFENILLIIYTDHNAADEINRRIPMIIHFPQDEHAGRLRQNAQNLDIAPTILDYLGLPKPDWMSGASLLGGTLEDHRLIFSTVTLSFTRNEIGGFILNPRQIKAPFYQFNTMNIIECQKWYQVNLPTNNWSSGDVPGHTAPCDENSLSGLDEIKQALIHRLVLDGFDPASLH